MLTRSVPTPSSCSRVTRSSSHTVQLDSLCYASSHVWAALHDHRFDELRLTHWVDRVEILVDVYRVRRRRSSRHDQDVDGASLAERTYDVHRCAQRAAVDRCP